METCGKALRGAHFNRCPFHGLVGVRHIIVIVGDSIQFKCGRELE